MCPDAVHLAAGVLVTIMVPLAGAQSCPHADEWAATATDGIRYGRAVDVTDTFLAVGDYSANSYMGRVFLRKWNGSDWDEPQVLTGADAGESFGTHTSLSEDWIAISVPDYNDGAVDLYNHNGLLWNYDDTYETPSGFTLKHMDLSYPWLVVAELSDDTTVARLQMLQHDAATSTWPLIETLTLPLNSGYVIHVALDQEMLVVGLPTADVGANTDCGVVWSYQFSGGAWNSLGYSTLSQTDGQYGQFIALDASTNTTVFAHHGAYMSTVYDDAYVNVRRFNGASWDIESMPSGPPWTAPGSQINSLAINGDDLVVVLWNVFAFEFSTHHLQRSDGEWYYQSEVTPTGAGTDRPRYVAALQDGMLVMDGGTAATERAAWVLPLEDCDYTGKADICEVMMPGADGNGDSELDRCACPGDLDFDADRDGDDIIVFVGLWAGGTAAGDLDADGTVGVLDLLVVLQQWGECP